MLRFRRPGQSMREFHALECWTKLRVSAESRDVSRILDHRQGIIPGQHYPIHESYKLPGRRYPWLYVLTLKYARGFPALTDAGLHVNEKKMGFQKSIPSLMIREVVSPAPPGLEFSWSRPPSGDAGFLSKHSALCLRKPYGPLPR